METAFATESSRTSFAILERAIRPDLASYAPEMARAILKVKFAEEDQERVAALLEKNREDGLTAEEKVEIDEYLRADNFLGVLQSKARLSLKKAGLSPEVP